MAVRNEPSSPFTTVTGTVISIAITPRMAFRIPSREPFGTGGGRPGNRVGRISEHRIDPRPPNRAPDLGAAGCRKAPCELLIPGGREMDPGGRLVIRTRSTSSLRTLGAVGAALLLAAASAAGRSSAATPTAAPVTQAPVTQAPVTPAPVVSQTPAASAVASLPTTTMSGTVAFLLPDNTTPRWMSQDAPSFQKWMHQLAPNVKVITDVANEDPQQQLSQAQAALTQGAQVLVVTAVDGTQAAQIVKAADAKNVPVIAYTRSISNADVKYMTGDDPYQIGVSLGQWMADHTKQGDTIAVIAGSTTDSFAHLEHDGYFSVLKPLFDSGARKMVGDVWTPEWDPVKAHAEMDAILSSANNNVQGVLCANDSTAEGAIASLQTHGLAGKIPVTGIDATLASDQLILKGLQSMSVWRSVDDEAQYTAILVVDLLTNQTPDPAFFTSKANNGFADIPMKGVPSTVIDATNMQKLIDAGAIDKTALCQGFPAGTGPC